MKFELILEKGNYALIDRGLQFKEFAIVKGLNKEQGDWDYTCGMYPYEYKGIASANKAEALANAIEEFRSKTEENYISKHRIEELLKKFANVIMADKILTNEDAELTYSFFTEECEMTKAEKELVGIEM